MMHNVRLSNIQKKHSECKKFPEAATVEFNLHGEWRTSPNNNQFGGTLSFPQGELNLEADFPPFLGGEGRAPSALAYCFYGAMSCYGSTFATQAAMADLEIDRHQHLISPACMGPKRESPRFFGGGRFHSLECIIRQIWPSSERSHQVLSKILY